MSSLTNRMSLPVDPCSSTWPDGKVDNWGAMKKLLPLSTVLLLLPCIGFSAIYTWDGGATNDRFSSVGNWDPTAPTGGPQSGDTGTVSGTYRVEVGTAGELTTGAEITFNDSSYLERNSVSYASMGGIFTFNDSTAMNVSDLRLTAGAVLNWDSAGTFTIAPSGAGAITMFTDVSTSSAYMSDGLWAVTSNGTDGIDVNGTFTMTGGKMEVANRLRVDGTFNLGGTAELYVADEFIDGVLNFVGTSPVFYHAGSDYNFAGRLDGNVQINGIAQNDLASFNLENVLVGGDPFTRISVVPEPSTFVLTAGLLALGLTVVRRRLGFLIIK